jgi:hypothetical protein
MYDFQRETKAEMMGLHLDLLRMGRGWKTEFRTLMDEYVGDLRNLKKRHVVCGCFLVERRCLHKALDGGFPIGNVNPKFWQSPHYFYRKGVDCSRHRF